MILKPETVIIKRTQNNGVKFMLKKILIISVIIICFFNLFLNEYVAKESESSILDYINLTKDELLKKLGTNYQIVPTGAEGACEGYRYEKIGITIVFDDFLRVDFIECDEKVVIKGVRAGMNFSQIQQKLGKTTVIETWIESPENKIYQIRYAIGNCNLIFNSEKKNGNDSSLTVQRIGATYFKN